MMTVEGSEANALLMREALARFSPSPEQRHYAWAVLADEVKEARARITELEAELEHMRARWLATIWTAYPPRPTRQDEELQELQDMVTALKHDRKLLQTRISKGKRVAEKLKEIEAKQYPRLLRDCRAELAEAQKQLRDKSSEALLRRIARQAERLYEDGEYEDAADRIYAMTDPYRKES
ncbi:MULTISPECIES: hypothetical protein [Corynebacterium]|uniref:hypothetical protein n=1 Tax=Corynebacterium TaxID=1716 RepID=UPI00124C5491|nr:MULTISPECIES: hypothetical protein [Corynebacterium]